MVLVESEVVHGLTKWFKNWLLQLMRKKWEGTGDMRTTRTLWRILQIAHSAVEPADKSKKVLYLRVSHQALAFSAGKRNEHRLCEIWSQD